LGLRLRWMWLRWMRILWRRVRYRFISWLLRVRAFPRRRLAGLLRGVRVLRICSRVRRSGVRCARLHHSGLCAACLRDARLHHGSLCAACLRDARLRGGNGGPCKHGPSGAGVCSRSRHDVRGPRLRQPSTPVRTCGYSRRLHYGPNNHSVDAAARADNGSDLLLDGSAQHGRLCSKPGRVSSTPGCLYPKLGFLLRQRPVGRVHFLNR
jgi:hypothetical protein